MAFSVETGNEFLPFHERANEILHNTWSANLAIVHDREILVDSKHYEDLLKMVLSREDISKMGPETKCSNVENLPAWRCFVRAVDTSQLLITLMPKTLRDTKLLFLMLEKCKCVMNAADSKLESPIQTLRNILGGDVSVTDNQAIDKKNRQRKTSEPNCGLKPASSSLTKSLALETACITGGRKRIRALSGGESAPVFKKAFRVDSTFNEILTQNFFHESFSKYIVPRDSNTIIKEDLQREEITNSNTILKSDVKSESSNVDDQTDHNVEGIGSSIQSMFGSLTMPLFVYDCSLSTLRNHVIFKGSSDIVDSCLDFRIFEVTTNVMENISSGLDCDSTTQDTGANIRSNSEVPDIPIQDHCNELQLAYKIAYIQSVFQSLQLGYYISTEDLKAVISLCHKDSIPIDISEFLRCVCMHISNPEESCQEMEKTHSFIQKKFQEIIKKDFNFIKVDSNLFFYKCYPVHRSYENVFSSVRCDPCLSARTSECYEDGERGELLRSSESDHCRFSECSQRRESEGKEKAFSFPLFMYIKCTTTAADITSSTIISDLPVCIHNLDDSFVMDILQSNNIESIQSNVKLELVFLTCPTTEKSEKADFTTETSDKTEETWPVLPHYQMDAVKSAVTEIQWLLEDEITSFRSKSNILTAEILQDISTHVEKSAGKLGCFQQSIPLKFVNNASVEGYSNFIQRFHNLYVDGLGLKKLEDWWYLVSFAPNNSGNVLNLNTTEADGLEAGELFSTPIHHQSGPDPNDISPFNSVNPTANTGTLGCVEKKNNYHLLPFWMIFRVEQEYVISYCHSRYNEDDLTPLQQCKDIRELMLNAIVRLLRIVNQDLLLQSLHDTRICSPLLEPEGNRQSFEDTPLFFVDNFDCIVRTESDIEGQAGHNIQGMFCCDIVWETTFKLHPRLRSGPGKSAFSRGIQILRSTLVAFEVTNRENLFVYRNSKGHVFYLRLYRVYETFEDNETDLHSENPSPRSSISSKSRGFDMAELQNKEDLMFGISKEPPAGPRDRLSDGVVLLKVHGITEAGSEIKEQLIQSLRNKLDDAVLDVLSITLDRNPHCKLTPEDVHFIQKPKSAPDAVVRFTTGRFTKLLLPAFAFYLHQNLLQFLNIPKYTRNELEYHFLDYFRAADGQTPDEQNVYLYNQSRGPLGGTGSRGVACVSVALINKYGVIRDADWKRPSDFLFSLEMIELSSFIETEEITKDSQLSDVFVELCVWKQGRINLDILKNNFSSAIKYGGWDLAMEFQVLTPPLYMETSTSGKSDRIFGNKVRRSTSPTSASANRNSSDLIIKRRNSSASNLDTKEPENCEEIRGRSFSYTVRRNPPIVKDGKQNVLLPLYNKTTLENTISSETLRSGQDFITARRNIVEDYNKLDPNYANLLKRWCGLGTKMTVPSLRVVTISLKPRHYLNETLEELVKIVHSVAPDNSTSQFWKLDKNMREFLTIGDTIYPKYRGVLDQACKEAAALKSYETKFKSLERKDESEYPEELLKLFRTQEHFQPSNSQNLCILIARNIAHWEKCVTNQTSSDPTFHIPEVMKSMYKFSPLISDSIGPSDDRSSINTEKLRLPTRKGLLALLEEANDDGFHSLLIPRQRFLLATVSKSSIEFIFYNWSKESSDKLSDQTKLLAQWTQSRMQLLSTVLLQKSGLFYNQPFLRQFRGQDPSTQAFGGIDLKDLVLSPCPLKSSIGLDSASRKKPSDGKSSSPQLSDIYRNLHHSHMLRNPEDIICSPIKAHGEQILSILASGKRDIESALFRYWLSRGPSASNVIGMEAIEALKQAARIIHYCMTPIFFHPRWRNAVAATRDNSIGLFKRVRSSNIETSSSPQLGNFRDRNFSESSSRSYSSSIGMNKSPIWSVWKRLYSGGSQDEDWVGSQCRNSRKAEESWHFSLCNTFIQEYMQYLQTLGFIPTHSNSGVVKRKQLMLTSENWAASYVGRMERVRRMSDGSVWSSESEKSSSSLPLTAENHTQIYKMDKDDKIFYLQKSLPGGIILLEVGLQEPFCYCKIHALEAHRIQPNKIIPKAATSHNTLVFVDECDKMKISMHLHSFAYDFHLRCIHSYICGKQLLFKQGYHVTKFLDDFISYYCKGPNFARNTVHIGVITMQNVSTPSHILFNYILSHDQTYQMKVMRMIPLNASRSSDSADPPAEYILVHNISKKVAYKESEDESHFDEFEMSLLISHDSPSSIRPYSADPSVLRMKYYIVLTSRRELYPKVINDPNTGKLYPVTAPEPLSTIRPDIRTSFNNGKLLDLVEEQIEAETVTPTTEKNAVSNINSEQNDRKDSTKPNIGPDGIREEKVLYMGFFSSHEQMMQEIVNEQTKWAEIFIHTVVGKAAVDCRRDLLWQRLLVGGRVQEKFMLKKDDLTIRETVGVLTYWEFSELLELVHAQSIREMDSRLKTLLNQPISFFQSLIKLLTSVNQYQHRYFVAPDESVHQLTIVNPNINKSVVMIEVNLEKKTSDLSILFKEVTEAEPDHIAPDLDPEIVQLIESAVGACCFCNWINLL